MDKKTVVTLLLLAFLAASSKSYGESSIWQATSTTLLDEVASTTTLYPGLSDLDYFEDDNTTLEELLALEDEDNLTYDELLELDESYNLTDEELMMIEGGENFSTEEFQIGFNQTVREFGDFMGIYRDGTEMSEDTRGRGNWFIKTFFIASTLFGFSIGLYALVMFEIRNHREKKRLQAGTQDSNAKN